jgi:antitoxin HicB
MSEPTREYEVVLATQPDGGFVVTVPDLPDVVTEGASREEALAVARDAIEAYLGAMHERGWAVRGAERARVVVRAA